MKRTYYAPIYFAEKDPNDTHCTLLVRVFEQYTTKSGNTVTSIKVDSYSYSTPEIMAKDIESQAMLELPPEAERQPMWVPDDMKSKTVRRIWA